MVRARIILVDHSFTCITSSNRSQDLSVHCILSFSKWMTAYHKNAQINCRKWTIPPVWRIIVFGLPFWNKLLWSLLFNTLVDVACTLCVKKKRQLGCSASLYLARNGIVFRFGRRSQDYLHWSTPKRATFKLVWELFSRSQNSIFKSRKFPVWTKCRPGAVQQQPVSNVTSFANAAQQSWSFFRSGNWWLVLFLFPICAPEAIISGLSIASTRVGRL